MLGRPRGSPSCATVFVAVSSLWQSSSVPADHGSKLDVTSGFRGVPDEAEENSDYAVPVLQCWALADAAEYLERVTESDVLEDQRFAEAEGSPKQAQNELKHSGSLAAGRS